MKWIDPYDKQKYIEEKEDHILAKGGDGTLIRAIHRYKDKTKPFYGVAKGTVNFLMNETEDFENAHDFQFFNLINVEVTYEQENDNMWVPCYTMTENYQAFNDIILGEFNAWIEFNCEHEDNILGKFMGSALLVSTAQGSTGANRNNNGTILPLSSKNWSVTGVMTNRNINYVLNSNELVINVKSRSKITLYIDGSHKIINNVISVKLTRGDTVGVVFNDIKKFKEKRQQN